MGLKTNCKKIGILVLIGIFILSNQFSANAFYNHFQTADTVIDLITNDTSTSNKKLLTKEPTYYSSNTTSKKNWLTTPPLSEDSAANVARKLLAENEVFTDSWSSASVFVYEKNSYSDLPETIEIPLLKKGERFQLTWYGNLNFKYGMRWGRMHKGLDLFLRTGDSVVAAFDGVVRYAQFNSGGFGNCVVVRHTNGLETVYAHLSKIMVSVNQYVQGGETVGLGGTTGNSSGPHLHFETRYKDFPIDPETYFDFKNGKLISDKLVIDKNSLSSERYPSGATSSKKYSKRSKAGSKSKYGKKGSKKNVKKSGKKSTKSGSKKSSTNKKSSKSSSSKKASSKKASTNKKSKKK
jgi:murein DD-endopeptidase MepM/ murein hydrolase activator NlpD